MAPGLGERSTANPGQLAWAALSKTIHILKKKRRLNSGKVTPQKIG